MSLPLVALLTVGCSGGNNSSSQPVQGSPAGPDGTQCSGGTNTSSAAVGCTLTQGYWKNHPDVWPLQSLTIGGVSYTKDELLALFGTPPAGDASLILAHQLIAAMLNVASGAVAPSASAQAIADAQAWMTANLPAGGKLPYGTSGSAGDAATKLGDALDQFNMGAAGVPHCSDGPGSGGQSSGSNSGCQGGGNGGNADGGANGTKPPPIGSGGTGGTGGGGTGVL
jgi:hypothetical protein